MIRNKDSFVIFACNSLKRLLQTFLVVQLIMLVVQLMLLVLQPMLLVVQLMLLVVQHMLLVVQLMCASVGIKLTTELELGPSLTKRVHRLSII